jgi:putative endonuclease
MPVWLLLGELLTKWRARWFPPLTLGQQGERAAVKFLRRQGYIIIAQSHRRRFSEIDIIAVDGRTVVFVEVKTRSNQDAGHPADAVDADKQRRLTRAAQVFRKQHSLLEHSARFDVIAITWPAGKGKPLIEHFKNAFDATE